MHLFRKTKALLLSLLTICCVSGSYANSTSATWTDIKLNLMNGAFLTAEEMPEGDKPLVNFGVAIAEDGTQTRVLATDETANIILEGKFHSDQHGWNNFKATTIIPAGTYKIDFGTCAWGGDVTISFAGETIETLNSNNGTCFHSNTEANFISTYYVAATEGQLIVAGGNYAPYLAITAISESDIPNEMALSYSLGDTGAEGELPANATLEIGQTFKTPVNRTLYVEGKTMTGWTDGTNTYTLGQELTATGEEMTLTPIFTDNQVALADRTETVSITWDFQQKNNAPVIAWQSKTAFWVAQAIVNDETIDVKMPIDATNGKIANGSWSDWAQINNGTILTIPACKGAVVSLESYDATTTTTIAGDIINQETKTPTYTYEGDAETIDIVIGDGSYWRTVQVDLPVATTEDETGDTFNKISSLEDLTDGEYIIVGLDERAMGPLTGKYYSAVVVTPVDGAINNVGDTLIWNIKKDADGLFTIEREGNYVASNGSKNEASAKTDITAASHYTVTYDEASGTFKFADNLQSDRSLQYNNNNNQWRFAHYKNTLKDLILYKKYTAPSEGEGEGEDEGEETTGFKDFAINLQTQGLLTDAEYNDKTVTSFGVCIDSEGNMTRVEKDDASANFVLNGKYHNAHGWLSFSANVPVEGPVLISLGTCQYGGGDVTITNAEGDVVLEMNTNNGTCYAEGNEATIVSDYYRGGATTLTIQSNNYTPYLAVKAVAAEDLPEEKETATITFDLTGITAEGTAPKEITAEVGTAVTIPVNNSLYVAGKTLSGWTDGTATYAPGTKMTIAANATLTPVFTDNVANLADRTSEVVLNWYFGEKNGAPALNSGKGIIVTQTNVNGTAIDVKMDYDATNGKIYNLGRGDIWAQVNSGTIFTIPSCKDAVVSMNAYSAISTTTIDGQSDYTSGNDISYTVANTAETIDIVIGDGSYYSYIKVVLPVDESSAPKIEERAIINTDFTTWESVGSSGGSVDITTNFSNENIKFTLNGTSLNPAGTNSGKFGDAIIGWVMAEKDKSGEVITSTFKNITKVRYFHGATGSNRGWAFQKKSANDADWVTLSDAVANPAAGVWVEKEINEENVQLRWYNLADAQNAYMFNLEVYANVEITAKQVALTTVVSPEEAAGSINVYPASPSYDEGSELTLTATENFGYNFVNWTNSAGEEVSTEAKFKYIINADETLTANFVKVNTYELAVAVEGGANDYMISFNPAPEIIDGKNMYEDGTVVEMTASSNAILTFTNWDSGETAGIKIVTMDDNKSFTASYSAADYIVGWDFIRRGNDGRPADFASTTDNETATLYMTNAEGNTKGWLDKSMEAAGGYESFVGAAVNWSAIADKYYYETKINASEFTNIKVQAEMMYNYNAYQTQKIEYSIDGQNWTEAGRMTMPAVKTECPIEGTLGTDANNAEVLYIRFIPDYTSNIDGTSSDNDGTTITNIFIFGDKKLVNDGKAPVLVSSVPEEGATGASATGKIVLNFDEKVKLTANAKATISGEAVEGAVTGKTITFAYTGLEYNTQYVFTLDGGSVSDLTDNAIAEAITINFTTMVLTTLVVHA